LILFDDLYPEYAFWVGVLVYWELLSNYDLQFSLPAICTLFDIAIAARFIPNGDIFNFPDNYQGIINTLALKTPKSRLNLRYNITHTSVINFKIQ